ncbi:phage tail tape measure protein [Blautia schinkii]|nr:phage tail tape measure protein [Blautia schinkii]
MASKSNYELAVEIAGKVAGSFGKSISTVNKSLSGLGKIAGAGAKLATAGFAAAGAAIAGVAAASVNVGKEFEAQMSTVQAISGATGEEFAAMEAKAKEMGATTQFSATEAGEAMEYMAMAGWKSGDMIDGIGGIMNLAAASGEDLATTSDIVTDALTAFGMTASESGKFADILAAASSNANTNVSMMGESFKYVAPLAGTLGYSAEDVSVALGLMANAGIKGSQAGTSLKTALANLASPTGKQAAAMADLGISLTDSSGEMLSMRDVMTNLRESFSGLDESQQAAAASTIFGKEAMSGMLAIINASEDDWNKLTTAIDNSSGAAADMAAIRLDNLEGDVTILKSGLEGLGIEIYEEMNAPLREVTQAGTDMISQLNAAFQEGGFSGMVGALGDVLSQAVVMVSGFAPQFVQMAVDMILSFANGISANSGQIATSATQVITVLLNGLLQALPVIMVTGLQMIAQLAAGLAQAAPQIVSNGVAAIQYLIQGILTYLPSLISSAQTIVFALLQGLIAAAPQIISGAVQIIGQLVLGIVQMLPTLVQMGLQLIVTLANSIVQNIPYILSVGIQVIIGLINGIGQALPMIAQTAIQLIVTLIQGIASNLGNIVQSAIQLIFAFGSGILQAIPTIVMLIPQLVEGIISAIFNTDWIAVGGQLIDGIKDGIMSGFTSLIDGVKGMWGKFTDWITGGGDDEDVGEAMAAEIEASTPTATAAASSAAQQTAAAFQIDPSLMNQYGVDAANGLSAGITAGTPGVTTAASALGTQSISALDTSFTANMPLLDSSAQTVGLTATNGLATGFQTGSTAAADAASQASQESINAITASLQAQQSEIVANASQIGTDATNAIGTGLNSAIPSVSATASAAGTQSITAMTQSMSDGAASITATINQLSSDMQTAMSEAWSNINTTTQNSFSSISQQISTQVSNIGTSVSTAFSGMATQLSAEMNKIKATANTSFSGMASQIRAQITIIKTAATTGFSGVQTAVLNSTTQTTTQMIATWRTAQSSLAAVWNSLRGTFASAWSGVHSYAVSAARSTAAAIKSAFEGMSITVPRPRLPHVSVSYTTTGSGGATVSVPNFSVSYYAQGGIMTDPTMFGMVGGEAGPEAILPLDTFWTQLHDAFENVLGFQSMQSGVPGMGSRASEVYDQITNNETINNNSTQNSSEDKIHFTYAPNVTIQGNASREDVEEALSMSQDEFNRMFDEYVRQKGRTAFA